MSNLNQARNMRLGVAVPIKNMKYRFGTIFDTVLNADGPTDGGGDWYFTVDPTIPASLSQIFLSDKDRLLLGPSTHSDNPGAREIVTVSSTTYPSTIHVDDEPTYLYLDGDRVSGVGERLPGNWDPSDDNVSVVSPAGLRDQAYGSEAVDGGVYDQFRCRVRLASGEYLRQDLGNLLLPSTQYLFGCFYKVTSYDTNGPNLAVLIHDDAAGTNAVISETIHYRSGGQVNDWTFFLSDTQEGDPTFTASSKGVTSSAPDGCWLRIPWAHSGNPGDNTWFELDMPFLCHAQRTSDFRAGIYTFDHLPVLGSGKWSWTDGIRQVRLANGELREYDPTGGGGRIRKYTFSCRFENTSADFFDQITTLQRWQEEGNDLVLVTGEQYYGGSLPPVLVGRMSTKQVDRQHWALGLRSFTFTFTEI